MTKYVFEANDSEITIIDALIIKNYNENNCINFNNGNNDEKFTKDYLGTLKS